MERYTAEQLEREAKHLQLVVNAALARLPLGMGPDETIRRLLPPGWEYVIATHFGGLHKIVITQYNP